MDKEMQKKVEATVLEILRDSDMDSVTEFKVRPTASPAIAGARNPRTAPPRPALTAADSVARGVKGYRGGDLLDVGGVETVVGGRSLSLTLRKLYIWEKKWYDEIQYQAISEAKNLDSIVFAGTNPDLAMELELELIKWIVNFSSWVNAQRSFIKALNGWLTLCLNYQQGETVDGVPPYSPGRVGAPLVFVICNSWSQVMDRISKKEVVTTMQALVSSVRSLWEQQNVEQSEQLIAIWEGEKWTKILERKTLEINNEADTLNRKLALLSGRQSLLPTAQTSRSIYLRMTLLIRLHLLQ
ncbi:hypothetical protein ABZP36_014365 [Zizania latifolia]